MRRALVIVSSVGWWAGCVAFPEEQDFTEPTDAAIDGRLVLDGGLQRPPTGKPYAGPQCGTADPPRDAGAHAPAGERDAAAPPDGQGDPLASGSVAGDDAGTAPPSLPRPARAGDVVITEIMVDPAAHRDDAGEWIELWNALPDRALSLEGCLFDDGGATPRKLGPLAIEPLAYATIARSDGLGFAPSLVASFSLANSSDTVAIVCDGVEIDRVRYDASFPVRPGASLSLDPSAHTAEDNDVPEAWCPAVEDYGGDRGSPGAPNPSCTPAGPADAGAP